MRFFTWKCKMLYQDWYTSTSEIMMSSLVVERVDNSTYLGSPTRLSESVLDQISVPIQRVFAKLCCLWHRRDIRLLTKRRVYCAAVCSVLLHRCGTWSSWVEDVRRLLEFDHRFLRSTAHVSWNCRVSDSEVRNRVLGFERTRYDDWCGNWLEES